MARKTLSLLLLPLAVGCTSPQKENALSIPAAEAGSPPLDNIGGGPPEDPALPYRFLGRRPAVLAFGNGVTLNTQLDDLKESAHITSPLGRDWYVFSGRKANDARPSFGLFIISPDDSESMHRLDKPWHMPGHLIDPKGKVAYYGSEVFAGEVLPDTIGVIWYERSQMPDGQWKMNTTLLNLNAARPDTEVFFGQQRKSATLNLAFQGKCHLLDSMDQRLP